jgi:hypothetical protein
MTTTSMALLACLAGTAGHAGQPHRKVTAYLLDRANEQYMDCTTAEALAGKMSAAIGISLKWGKGEPVGESSQPPILIEVVTATPENFKPGSLAYALPYEGSHITVFVNRIERMRAPSNVLAPVMVHEITHILQGISRHSATGVMKERWAAGDFADMRFRPLAFTLLDIELIYSGLAQRTTGTSVLVCDSR